MPITSSGLPQRWPRIDTPPDRLLSISVNAMISFLPSFQLQRPNTPMSSVTACSRFNA